VVVGAYYGKGKRTAVYGAFLLACYDSEAEEWQTICKIGTGFSDEALQTHYEALKDYEVSQPRGDIKIGSAKPDVWFTPRVVWEVLTADLSLSPVYAAAQGLVSGSPAMACSDVILEGFTMLQVDQRGISLRFPRFIRVRDDKDAEDATGPQQVGKLAVCGKATLFASELQGSEPSPTGSRNV
jgi:DNA ligase-1